MQTLQQFISSEKISMAVEWTDGNPNMSDDKWSAMARHFRCVLKRKGRQLTIPFSQGLAHEREPTAADVLDCLASDASGIENARSFEEWCYEYGFDTDSRKAEKTYRICIQQAQKPRHFLGENGYDDLLWNIERQ